MAHSFARANPESDSSSRLPVGLDDMPIALFVAALKRNGALHLQYNGLIFPYSLLKCLS